MESTFSIQLNNRDRAVLKAIAQGRCQVSGGCGTTLLIDGLCCADQFVGSRLAHAGLITVPGQSGPVSLSASAMALVAGALR
jgi:hypothetical protein